MVTSRIQSASVSANYALALSEACTTGILISLCKTCYASGAPCKRARTQRPAWDVVVKHSLAASLPDLPIPPDSVSQYHASIDGMTQAIRSLEAVDTGDAVSLTGTSVTQPADSPVTRPQADKPANAALLRLAGGGDTSHADLLAQEEDEHSLCEFTAKFEQSLPRYSHDDGIPPSLSATTAAASDAQITEQIATLQQLQTQQRVALTAAAVADFPTVHERADAKYLLTCPNCSQNGQFSQVARSTLSVPRAPSWGGATRIRTAI